MKCYIPASINKTKSPGSKNFSITYEHRCFPEICGLEFNVGDKIYVPTNLFYAFINPEDALSYSKTINCRSDSLLECECADGVIEKIKIKTSEGPIEIDMVKGQHFNIIKISDDF